MRRTVLGWIVVSLLAGGLLLRVWRPDEIAASDACFRAGLMLGVLWVALPEVLRLPRWAIGGTLAASLLVLWRPKLLLIVLPVLLAMWMLRPRPSRRPRKLDRP